MQAGEQPTGLLDLPDDLGSVVLRLLPLAQRERGAALVCRRLHRLCAAPELLHTVECSVDISTGGAEARLHGLARWLERRAGSLRQLQLCAVGVPAALQDQEHYELADGLHPGVLLLARAFQAAACAAGTAGTLDRLTLRAGRLPLRLAEPHGPQLPPARHLAVRQSGFGTALVVAGALPHGIEHLELIAPKGLLRLTGAAFPASLTALHLTGDVGGRDIGEPEIERTLPQLATLSRLQRLQLADANYDAQACGTLAHLPALTELRIADQVVDWRWCMCHCTRLQRLSLRQCDYICLGVRTAAGRAAPALTWLECQYVFHSSMADFASFPSLPGLRELVWWDRRLPPLPAAWTALTRLQLSAAAAQGSAAEVQAARAASPGLTVTVIDEEDEPLVLPPSLHQVKEECAALRSWLRSLGACVPYIHLDTAARRRRSGQDGSTGTQAAEQAAAGGSSPPAEPVQQWCASGTAAELEPIEESLSRALCGTEVLDLEPAAEQPQRLVVEWSDYLASWRTFDMDFDQARQLTPRLERIGGLLAEAAAAAGASMHLLHTLMCWGVQVACVAPGSVWVLTLDGRRIIG